MLKTITCISGFKLLVKSKDSNFSIKEVKLKSDLGDFMRNDGLDYFDFNPGMHCCVTPTSTVNANINVM